MNSRVAKTLTTCFSKGRLEKVEVQVFVKKGISKFDIIGLPQNMIREGRDRIMASLYQMGLDLSSRKIIASLNPGDIPKEGSHFDLPIVIGILKSLEILEAQESNFYWGELELNGSIRSFTKPIPHFLFAQANCSQHLIGKIDQRSLHYIRQKIPIRCSCPQHLSDFLNGRISLTESPPPHINQDCKQDLGAWLDRKLEGLSFKDLKAGPNQVLLISLCAIGKHHLLLEGPPGVGKSLWPKIISELRPPLSTKDLLDLSKNCHGAIDLNSFEQIPFISPHHSSSMAAIVGGGSSRITAGAISRAHKGILFLDEFSEFVRPVIESLREPLENQCINVARSEDFQKLPAEIQLIASQNPCRCGGYQSGSNNCQCATTEFYRYRNKISEAIRDRFHWKVWWDFVDRPITEFRNETEWKMKILESQNYRIDPIPHFSFLEKLSARKQRLFIQKLEAWAKYFKKKEVTEDDARKLVQFEEEFSIPHPTF